MCLSLLCVSSQLKLLSPSTSRFEHLVTQMNWRLKEGSGEAIYEIGVSDDGLLCGLSQDDLDSSLETLRKMADRWELVPASPPKEGGSAFSCTPFLCRV